MTTNHYGKIVRAKTKEIIEARGSTPKFLGEGMAAKNAEKYFKQKLLEEVEELIEAQGIDDILDEAADVVQVVRDYLRLKGYDHEDLEVVRKAKYIKRGGFLDHRRIPFYLEYVENPD